MTRLGFLERKLHDEREKALDAARRAVVEAAKAWRSEPSMSTKFGLMNALDALEKLEPPMRKRPYFDLPVEGYTYPVLRVSALAGGVKCGDIANGVMLEFRPPDGRGEGSWVVDRDSMLMLLRAIEEADHA